MTELAISRAAARRWLLARQGLLAAPGGPQAWRQELKGAAGARAAIARLQCVQIDPMALVERNHHLVLQARVGAFAPADLDGLFAAGAVFEYYANALCLLPIEGFPYLWPAMVQARWNQAAERRRHGALIAGILDHIRRHGPTAARELGNDGPRLAGYGWDPAEKTTKASNHVLDLLWLAGEIMVARRQGNEKYWDLTERVLPPHLAAALPPEPPPGPPGAARVWKTSPDHPSVAAWLAERYIDAFGLFDAGDFRWGWQHHGADGRKALLQARLAAGAIVPVRIEGVKRAYYAPAAAAGELQAAAGWEPEPAIAFLPPLDNLLWRRERLSDLFAFDYTWEAYVPPAKRRFGAYVMPILEGDRLIGRLAPRLDRAASVLHVEGLWLEPGVGAGADRRRRLARALHHFAAWHGAAGVRLAKCEPPDLKLPL